MRILILNWRDVRHPRAGGAEYFTHEVAKRLVARGDQVEWFSAAFPGGPAEEDVDGVRIVREGRQWTVHWHAFRRYRHQVRSRFDVVIDEVNTIPFFTPLWVGVPTFMLIYQLAREVWWYESPFPINGIGYLVEPLYLRFYRRSPVITLAASTASDLRRLDFTGPITLLPNGVEAIEGPLPPKIFPPAFVYVGRLAPSKRLEHIIRAFAAFRQDVAPATLWVIGEGSPSYKKKLEALVHKRGISEAVSFLGRVKTLEKHRRMAQAHALLLASVREGWGLVVAEANACGTPAVVYDVPGLRDSVKHEETGLVVSASSSELAAGMRRLWQDGDLYQRLARAAQSWSATFSFDGTATALRSELDAHLEPPAHDRHGLLPHGRFSEPESVQGKQGT